MSAPQLRKFAHIPGVIYPEDIPDTKPRKVETPPPGYIPTAEAAAVLGVSPATAAERLKSCRCKCVMSPVRRKYFWHAATVHALAGHEKTAHNVPPGYVTLAVAAITVGCSRNYLDTLIADTGSETIRAKFAGRPCRCLSVHHVNRCRALFLSRKTHRTKTP